MVARFDILLERSAELDKIDSFILKAGDKIALKQEEGGPLEAVTSTGLVLGTVPAAEAEKIQGGGFVGHVRTLQRNPGTSLIRNITVRFAPEKALIQPVVNLPPIEDTDEENARKLSQEQLLQLANDDEIRRFLRDERLQNVVRDIDSAQNREAALRSMLKAPNFKEFTDKILSRIAPELPE
ncbi:hypothetical protein Ndes2437B_g02292 [Nannochloris sp. 'desiccata']